MIVSIRIFIVSLLLTFLVTLSIGFSYPEVSGAIELKREGNITIPQDCQEKFILLDLDCPLLLLNNFPQDEFFTCTAILKNNFQDKLFINEKLPLVLLNSLKYEDNEYVTEKQKIDIPFTKVDGYYVIEPNETWKQDIEFWRLEETGKYRYIISFTCDVETHISKPIRGSFEVVSNTVYGQLQLLQSQLETQREAIGTQALVTMLVGLYGFVGTLMGALVGGSLTYFAQKEMQRRGWKKKDIETIYSPLLDELENVKDYVNNFKSEIPTPEWNLIIKEHLQHKIPRKLRKEIFDFFKVELHNFKVSVFHITENIEKIIAKELDKRFKGGYNFERYYSFLPIFANLILQREETGVYLGVDVTSIVEADNLFREAKEYYNLEFEKADDFIRFLTPKFKDDPNIRDLKEKQKKIFDTINKLIEILNKQKRI